MATVDAEVQQVMESLREQGMSFELRTKGYSIIGHDGEPIRNARGSLICIPRKAQGKRWKSNLNQRLKRVGVNIHVGGDSGERRRRDLSQALGVAETQLLGQASKTQAKQLQRQMGEWVVPLGGWEVRGLNRDIARLAEHLIPDADLHLRSLETSVSRLVNHNEISRADAAIFQLVSDKLLSSSDPVTHFYELLREARGIETAEVTSQEWPFEIKLISIADAFADQAYQRPPHMSFVRELTLKFDERLVGTIDVSVRDDGRYAILDGQQRWEAMKRVGKERFWAAIYTGMSLADEADFFFHKNKDRKAIHPFYHYRARLVAGDEAAATIEAIVRSAGFVLNPTAGRDKNIAAVRAVEVVFNMTCEHRNDCLGPTLRLIHELWFGRKAATDANIIRGLGRFYQVYDDDELSWTHLEQQLRESGPVDILSRARDIKSTSSGKFGYEVARVIGELHNRGLSRGEKLDLRRLNAPSSRRGGLPALQEAA